MDNDIGESWRQDNLLRTTKTRYEGITKQLYFFFSTSFKGRFIGLFHTAKEAAVAYAEEKNRYDSGLANLTARSNAGYGTPDNDVEHGRVAARLHLSKVYKTGYMGVTMRFFFLFRTSFKGHFIGMFNTAREAYAHLQTAKTLTQLHTQPGERGNVLLTKGDILVAKNLATLAGH